MCIKHADILLKQRFWPILFLIPCARLTALGEFDGVGLHAEELHHRETWVSLDSGAVLNRRLSFLLFNDDVVH